jgi:methyl-accepting chemotaxis protein
LASFVGSIALGLIQAIILAGVLSILLRGLLLRQIRKIAEILDQLAEGKVEVELDSLRHSTKEIEDLITSLKKLNDLHKQMVL